MIIARNPCEPASRIAGSDELVRASWLDLVDTTPAEIAMLRGALDMRVPTRDDLDEIETSSRQYRDGDTLYLSMTLLRRVEDGLFKGPVGFVLSPDRLLSVRYTQYPVFDVYGDRLAREEQRIPPAAILVGLLEAVVDRLADVLEHTGGELDRLSRHIFGAESGRRGRNSGRKHDRSMRLILGRIGHLGELVSAVRDSLLGVQRIAGYLTDNLQQTCPAATALRLQTMQRDIGSLTDYQNQCMEKVHFLLDATLGFINIDQNGGLRLLTVVSFIGVAPTLIASIYGMNFKHMPELDWRYGYPYALGLMGTTICLPLLWFWRQGWLGRQ